MLYYFCAEERPSLESRYDQLRSTYFIFCVIISLAFFYIYFAQNDSHFIYFNGVHIFNLAFLRIHTSHKSTENYKTSIIGLLYRKFCPLSFSSCIITEFYHETPDSSPKCQCLRIGHQNKFIVLLSALPETPITTAY